MSTDITEQARENLERLLSKEIKYICIKNEGPTRNSDLYTINFFTEDFVKKSASYNIPKKEMEKFVSMYEVIKI
ncbi:hypothetical protein HOD61_01375 [archaeon]|jgi:hypothetical protein|nr:hypothetical protein [archaeon]